MNSESNSTIDKQIDALAEQVAEAFQFQHLQYSLYSEEGWDVLMKTMPEIWGVIQRSLFYATFSSIGRLFDKEFVCGSKNLTVTSVANELDSTGKLTERVEDVLETANEAREKLIRGRHKIASHPDYEHLMGDKKFTYYPDEVDLVLKAVAEAVDILYEANGSSPYPWHHPKSTQAYDLLATLQAGQKVHGVVN